MKMDVVALGNALVDVLAQVDEGYLTRHGLTKGSSRLVDAAEAAKLYADMPPAQETSGGSAANTVAALASLGGRAGFLGKVAEDALGHVFRHDLKAQGVTFAATGAPTDQPTGRCLVAVTPDAERTMNVSLGCSAEFGLDNLHPEFIASAKVLYLEGYLFNQPPAKAAFRAALQTARAAGAEVALTLSDGFCVDMHRADFLALIAEGVDILFTNEAEIMSLYNCEFEAAMDTAAQNVKVAVLTRGAEGAVICRGHERVKVAAEPAQVVDLTGAGDAYAAGFLYGYTQGLSLAESGRLGALCAAEAISHFGARPEVRLSDFVKARKAA